LVTELVTEGDQREIRGRSEGDAHRLGFVIALDQREIRGRSEGDAHRLGFVIALDAPTTERHTPVPDEGGHQRSLEAVRGDLMPSEALRGNQWQSDVPHRFVGFDRRLCHVSMI
jgi:hypothetical protein